MQFDSDLAAPLLWPEIPLGAAPQQLNDSISLPPQPSIEKPQDNPHASKSPEKGISKPTTANGDIVAKSQPSRTSHQKPAQPKANHDGQYKCGWKHCRYTGVFRRKPELMRHIETKHVSPGSYQCPERVCTKSFNRIDNMKKHVERVH
ncbi:hypothetical protein FQN53_008671 [Emmonsiellopsis sp. PD_33]|nr:hypothetical protein FQN53_008671 [Emmonsiellopsis sp. PD_33]